MVHAADQDADMAHRQLLKSYISPMLPQFRHPNLTRSLFVETLSLPRQYRTILIPSSTLQLVIDPAMAVQSLQRLAAHLLPGGIVVASFMTVWKAGDPLSREWEQSAVREEDGATFRRIGHYWYDVVRECTDTEDRYQVLMDDQIVAEEVHRRSPALRSYTQAQAQAVFDHADFNPIELCSGLFTFEPVKADDIGFTVVGHKANEV
jgi:hypothetical protein